MNFFKKATRPMPEPETDQDHLAIAHAAMKAAEVLYYKALSEKNLYESRSLTYGWKLVCGQRVFQNDDDTVRLLLNRNAGRAWGEWQRRINIWSDLKLKFSTNDAVHVAGERVPHGDQTW
jgi:hypothetical protein